MKGALLVAGTHSDVGKSVVVAGICRWLAREGVKVAPFKAQNMALNSFVTRGGAEIGRAQAAQAAAARVDPEAKMNPVLLKPSGERETQVILRGKPWAMASARGYQEMKEKLFPVVLESLQDLRRRFEVVVCEGAGSPAEINLRAQDLANMGLARAAALPTIIIGDIDRGGVFASLYGTLALLGAEDQALVGGFIVNKFRGDITILAPGLEQMSQLTGRLFLGTLPYVRGLGLDEEDSLALDAISHDSLPPLAQDFIKVAVVRLPRISNFNDFDALSYEPGVAVRFTESSQEILCSDLAVLPGTKTTVADLTWLRSRKLDSVLTERARVGLPTLGICGGYQMLGSRIRDSIESEEGEISGLNLLPVETIFEEEKILARPDGYAPGFENTRVSGYEIRHGRVLRHGGEPLFAANGSDEGCQVGATFGTSWHGIFESDGFRRTFLRRVARDRALHWSPGDASFAAAREAQLDKLGDLIAENIKRETLLNLIEYGPPADLPVINNQLLALNSRSSYQRSSVSGQLKVGDPPHAGTSASSNDESVLDLSPPGVTLPPSGNNHRETQKLTADG
ncbi:MAG: cobyric acid synthase [Rubrobacter sp.]|nr:cobyric acid synthase [Rubrobacter sp.]